MAKPSHQEIFDGLPSIRGASVARPTCKLPQTVNIPYASYAPWAADGQFQKAYGSIQGHTLVDIYRCYELWESVGQVSKLPGHVIEIGVWRGGTACLMAQRLAALGSTQKIFVCDTFEGVVKAGDRDGYYKGGEHADTSEEVVRQLFANAGVQQCVVLKGIFPDQTAAQVTDERFAFGHIDVDVYESARASFEFIWPRLVVSGIIVFDDYGFWSCEGVTRYVNELRGNLPGAAVFYNLNGHAIVVKSATG